MVAHRRITSCPPGMEEAHSLLNSHSRSESGSSIEFTQQETETSQRILVAIYETYTRATTSNSFKYAVDLFRRSLPRHASTASKPPSRSSSRTASYDGLRGIACLIVFNFHYLYPYTRTITHGYGVLLEDDAVADRMRNFHQYPIICLLFRGRAMVTLFFAISGYVLSYNFLAAMRNNQRSLSSLSRLSSLALRRWMRLYLPASVSMFLVALAASGGAFEPARKLENSEWRMGLWEQHPPKLKSLEKYMRDYCRMWLRWQSPWKWWSYYSDYDPHTWTIPTEFRDSMVLFMVLLASAGLKQGWRSGLIVLATIFCFANQRWDVAVFTGGAMVADIHLWQRSKTPVQEKESVLPTDSLQTGPPSLLWNVVESIFKYSLLVISLYVLSFPDDKVWRTPGYFWLHSITPPGYEPLYDDPYKFWQAAAAIPILWCVSEIRPINNFFSSSIPQYLGKISYGLYLCHGPLLHSIGFTLQPKIWKLTGGDTNTKYCFGLLLGWMTLLSISLVAAHLFWKYVDMPLVRLAKRLEKLASHEAES